MNQRVKRKCLHYLLLLFQLLLISLFCGKHTTINAHHFQNKRVLFLGDSITENGLYVSFIEYFLQKEYPSLTFDIISIGLGSETVSGLSENHRQYPRPCLFERLQRALENIKPDFVVACYGMNDGIYNPQSATRMKAYQDGILKLINDVKATGAVIILLTPPPFDALPVAEKVVQAGAEYYGYSAPFFRYDSVLADYSQWIMSLNILDVSSIDLHTPMNDFLNQQRQTDPNYCFSSDGVHPSAQGHLFMARQFLKALQVPLPMQNLAEEMSAVESDSLFHLVANHRQVRSAGWLKYIGYTRGETVKSDSILQVEKEAADLQAQIEHLLQFQLR
jgi:lysophospholipase L1-like esterase